MEDIMNAPYRKSQMAINDRQFATGDKRLATGALVLVFVCLLCLNRTFGRVERFIPRQGGTTELWRITNDPTTRDWANYHNAQCYSHDGRYICYAHYQPFGGSPPSEIHIYDLHEDKDIKVNRGTNPRWANNHNWLFYIRPALQDSPSGDSRREVMWLDVDANKLTRICYGLTTLGGSDCGDRWLYGGKGLSGKKQDFQGYRVAIRPDATTEMLEGLKGIQWMPNPEYPIVFVRYDHYYEPQGDDYFLTKGTRYWFNLEGKNVTIGSPQLQPCHQSWLGDGSYHLHGGKPMAGRRWDEPFPSNLHFLAAIDCGDISPCGRSGRWISGSGSYNALQVADTRSGDGWNYLKAALSIIHNSDTFDYSGSSSFHDCDAKGSPDGTKIAFVSNYDLKDGPVTEITQKVSGSRLYVKSTNGFPEKGCLSLRDEVIRYESKTPTSFEGLTRRLYRKGSAKLYPGRIVTSFEARCIRQEQRGKTTLPSRFARSGFPDRNSPLLWQRRTDIYLAVVRLPDRPHLWKTGESVELIPGENHWETYGYHVFRNGIKITSKPLRPGTSFTLSDAGRYTAKAVEWSGLESEHSLPLEIRTGAKLYIRSDKPADFSWIHDRWLVDGKEVSPKDAQQSPEAVKEIVHLVDGVIHRQWYSNGQISKRYDLNLEGKPIRRLFYQNGKLARREYHNRDGHHLSTEFFGPDGYITESVQYRDSEQFSHWWYERGMPVRYVGRGDRGATSVPKGPGTYLKEGNNWVKKERGRN